MTLIHRWSEVIVTDYSQYLFADFWTPVGEEVTFEDDMGLSRARLTGFLGMRSPWSAIVVCGTHNGPMRLTIEVHDSPVAQDQAHWTQIDSEWSEIIETTFQVRSGKVTFIQLFGEPITEVELLPIGPWRLRAHAKGRDEGHAKSSYQPIDQPPTEEHLIQFWPVDGDHRDLVITRDRTGAQQRGEPLPDPGQEQRVIVGDFPPPESAAAASWHSWASELPPPPTAAEIAEAERRAEIEAREREKRWEDDMYWGGVRPSERLRAVGGSSLVGVDRPLLDALAEADPESLRAIARWTARRAYDAAGLSKLEWVAPALAALERGETLPPPFDDWDQAWARLLGKDRVIQNVHVRAENAARLELSPRIDPQAAALPAIFAAADADPLRAALGAVDAAVVTFGNDYPRLLQDLRDAFPEVG